MKELARELRFQAAAWPGLLAWVLFLLWESFGLRIISGAGFSFAGMTDDAALVALGLAIFFACAWLPRWPRGVLLALSGLVLATFFCANALYHGFFRTFINIEAILIAGLVPAAQGSVRALLDPTTALTTAGLPLLALGVSVYRAVGSGPRGSGRFANSALIAMAGLLATHGAVADVTFSASAANGLFHIARQGGRLLLGQVMDATDRRKEIAEHREDTFTFPRDTRFEPVGEDHPVARVPATPTDGRPKNVVLILMESVRAKEMGLGSGRPSVTPNIDRFAEDGLVFDNFYGNGHQTIRGEVASLCGLLPHVGGAPVYFRYPYVRTPCLPEILADRGWSTWWISAYTANYANKREFLTNHGIQNIVDAEAFEGRTLSRPEIGWGPADEDMFELALETLNAAPKPFFAELMTLSNHHPFNHDYAIPRPQAVPVAGERRLYRNYLYGTHYTDYAVGRFIDAARAMPWFDDTLFVILADTGTWIWPRKVGQRGSQPEQEEVGNRIPLVIYSPSQIEAEHRTTVGSQIDLAPTLLDLLEVQAPNAFMGVSLLADVPEDERMAFISRSSNWSLRVGNRYCYSSSRQCYSGAGIPACPQDQRPWPSTHACFETSDDLLEGQATTRLLDDTERETLLSRGRRLVDYSRYLMEADALFPLEER